LKGDRGVIVPETVTVYNMLIAYPGDVSQFVGILENAVSKFNNSYGERNNIILRTINWMNNAFPQFGDHPQKILNQQIVDKSDFAVAVFWTRFGTETEDHGSGTEEEIERMLSRGKQVFLYFLDKPVQPSKIDQSQYTKIQKFKDKQKNAGLCLTFPNENDLANAFREHLELGIDRIVQGKQSSETKEKKLILWVDDCPENNIYVRNILEDFGLKFDLALSTERAFNHIQNNLYSLIISDMGRREGPHEGYELLKQIRNSGNNIPFIIYSSNGSRQEHKDEAKKNGAQGSTDSMLEVVDIVKSLINS
jgi:CheY-like chemotaxis protein